MSDTEVIIDIIGEGKTDRGPRQGTLATEEPGLGVLSNLVHALCEFPTAMRVRGLPVPFNIRGGPNKKVEFAKQQATIRRQQGQTHGLIYVIDTEGDDRTVIKDLVKGRDLRYRELPTAVGVAHPCIESWLLADATAIKEGLKLATHPILPETPESLPAPRRDRAHNPKTILCGYTGRSGKLTSAENTAIAKQMRDMALVRSRCPKSFAPFADEVIEHIKPLFDITPVIGE
jgi:hypothetical protein